MEIIVHMIETPFVHFSSQAKKAVAIGLFAFALYGLYHIAMVMSVMI